MVKFGLPSWDLNVRQPLTEKVGDVYRVNSKNKRNNNPSFSGNEGSLQNERRLFSFVPWKRLAKVTPKAIPELWLESYVRGIWWIAGYSWIKRKSMYLRAHFARSMHEIRCACRSGKFVRSAFLRSVCGHTSVSGPWCRPDRRQFWIAADADSTLARFEPSSRNGDALLAWSEIAKRARELTYREVIFARHSLFPPDSLARDGKATPKAAILGRIKIHSRSVTETRRM